MTTAKKTKPKTKRKRNPERLEFYEAEAFVGLAGTLADNLRRLREQRELSQEKAAELCGLPFRTLQNCESGTCNAGLVTISRLMAGLQVTVSQLLEKPKKRRTKPQTIPKTTTQEG